MKNKHPIIPILASCVLAANICAAADPLFALVASAGEPPTLADKGTWGGVLEWVAEEGPSPVFVESNNGGYLQFADDSRAAITLKDSAALLEGMPEEFTVAAWINPKAGRSGMEVISTGADSGADGGFRIRLINEQIWVRAGGDSAHSYAESPVGSVPRGGWTHVAVVVDRENVTLYLNGRQVDAAPWADSPAPPRLLHPVETYARGGFGLTIGNYGGRKDSYPFIGDLAGVRIYGEALDASAVEELANQLPD